MLSDFTWTPAPATITVAFDANGGTLEDADPFEYAPGDDYGDLPVPTRKGWTFLGWYAGSVDGVKVAATDKVAFEENITLVAKWGQALTADFLNIKKFTNFKLAGTDKWYKVDVPDLGTVAEVEPKGKEAGNWISPTVSSLVDTDLVGSARFQPAGHVCDGGISCLPLVPDERGPYCVRIRGLAIRRNHALH